MPATNDTTAEDSEGYEYDVHVDDIDLEARQAIYEDLCKRYGQLQIDELLDNQATAAASQAVHQHLSDLYDNRDRLDEQLDQQ